MYMYGWLTHCPSKSYWFHDDARRDPQVQDVVCSEALKPADVILRIGALLLHRLPITVAVEEVMFGFSLVYIQQSRAEEHGTYAVAIGRSF